MNGPLDLKAADSGGPPQSPARHEGPDEDIVTQPWPNRLKDVLFGGVGRSLASLIVGLAIWELIGRFIVTDRTFFVPFSVAVRSVFTGFAHGTMLTDLRVSSFELLGGFAVAAVVGVGLGTAMGLSSGLRSALIFWVDIFNATPIIALAPLFVLALGVGMVSKIAFVAFVAVWTILLNTMTGFMHPERGMLEMTESFGASSWQKFVIVRVPFAVPSMAVGFRIAIGRAAVGIVVGELFGSSAGLGHFLFTVRDDFDTGGIYAAIIVLALLALVAVNLMTLLERRLSKWR